MTTRHTRWSAAARVRRAIIAHAERDRPRECCGLLLGQRGRIEFAVPVRNLARTRTRYLLDPRAHIDWQRRLRDVQPPLEIVGVYHSHPRGAADPSPSDLAEANYPDWIHIIVGLGSRRPAVRACRIDQVQVRAITVQWR